MTTKVHPTHFNQALEAAKNNTFLNSFDLENIEKFLENSVYPQNLSHQDSKNIQASHQEGEQHQQPTPLLDNQNENQKSRFFDVDFTDSQILEKNDQHIRDSLDALKSYLKQDNNLKRSQFIDEIPQKSQDNPLEDVNTILNEAIQESTLIKSEQQNSPPKQGSSNKKENVPPTEKFAPRPANEPILTNSNEQQKAKEPQIVNELNKILHELEQSQDSFDFKDRPGFIFDRSKANLQTNPTDDQPLSMPEQQLKQSIFSQHSVRKQDKVEFGDSVVMKNDSTLSRAKDYEVKQVGNMQQSGVQSMQNSAIKMQKSEPATVNKKQDISKSSVPLPQSQAQDTNIPVNQKKSSCCSIF